MEVEKLMQTVQELVGAQSQNEAEAVLQRYPELLDESGINTLLGVAEAAHNAGKTETAELLERVAQFLMGLNQDDGESESSGEEAIAFHPISPESYVPWARLTRQFLTLRHEEVLEQAITEAQKSGEMEIVALLQARQEQDWQKVDGIAPRLYRKFIAAGRNEEGATIALVGLDLRATLAEVFMHYPVDQQAAALEAGLRACQEAAAFAKALGDEACQAAYKQTEGTGYTMWRRLIEAEQAYQGALELYRKLVKQQPQLYEPDVAMTLNNLGTVFADQGRLIEADQAYKEALELYRKLAKQQPQVYKPDVAMTLNGLGLVLASQQRLEQAEQAFGEALGLYRKLAKQQPQVYELNVTGTLNNLGNVLADQRRLEQAERVYREALGLYRKLAEQQPQVYELNVAGTLNNLGIILADQRRLEQAEQAFEEALELYRKLAEQHLQVYEPGVAMTLNNLGSVLTNQRRLGRAEQAYQEALELCRRLAEQQPQVYEPDVAMTLSNLGAVLSDQRRLEQAEQAYQEALKIRRQLAKQQPQVYEPDVAITLNNLGDMLWDREQAEQAYQEALTLCRRHDLPAVKVKVLSGIGQIQMDQTKWDEAAEALNEAVDQVERLRTEALNLDRRMQIMRENVHIYERLLICLMKFGRYQEALEVAERGKSRTLIDLLTLRDLRPKNAPPELAHEYERMLFQARALEDRLQRGQAQATGSDDLPPEERIRQQQQQIKSMQEELLRTNIRLQELVDEIRQHDPDFLPHAKPLSFTEIKTLAQDAQATLMLFRMTAAGSFIFLVFPDGETDVVQAPEFTTRALNEMLVKYDGDEPVDGWVVRYYGYQNALHRAQQTKKEEDEVAANQAWQAWLDTMEDTLGKLYQRLLNSVHRRLKEREQKTGERIERVVMVPNRGLAILPLHACWWEEDGKRRYLLDDYVITYAPSLSVFKRCLEREWTGRSKQTLLGIANPKPPGNLVFSEWECEEIERLLGNERCLFLWGEEATKAEMMRWIGERHWLHFSCHGQYRLDAPLSSLLSLANGDELTLGEILEKLNLQHTWLTVLSACETGLVDFREIADEHYGLPLGFLFAGAPTVWGTLWTVNDLTTALLMREAYQNLTGESASKPEALRDAQRWLRDAKAGGLLALVSSKQAALGYDRMAWYDLSPFRRSIQHGYDAQACPYSHPYYWAGMQCVGV